MAQIVEDYVSFETAKLLKEKGFNEKLCTFYFTDENKKESCFQTMAFNDDKIDNNHSDYCYLAPTLQMACKWLREVYYLHITAHPGVSEHGFVWTYAIVFAKEAGKEGIYFYKTNQITTQIVISKSYEQAVEAAIKYCLEKLI